MVKCMENKSLWTSYMRRNYTSSLNEDLEVDVLIIGGGITGLTTAYFLKNSNLNVTLIEKDHIGSGATAFTTGKLTYMQGLIYKSMPNDIGLMYLESQKDAIKIVKEIINKNNIDCNLETTSSYVFTDKIEEITDFKKEEKVYQNMNIKYSTHNKLPINFPCIYNIKTSGSYVFHPLKYLYSLKKIIINSRIKIYENTKAINLTKENMEFIVKTTKNRIKAKYVVIATQYPFFVNPYFLPFKTMVERSYVITGLVNTNKKFQAISDKKPINSIRYYTNKDKNYLIYSTMSHRITSNYDEGENYKIALERFKNNFNLDVKYYFMNQDVMTSDGLPLIGRVGNSNLLVGTGYNKWGMTNGTIAGKILSDIILNKENKYIYLFRLNRGLSGKKIINLTIYNFSNMKSYIISKVKNDYEFYSDNVKIVKENGVRYGIYTDKRGREYKVKNVCPHLKCNLIFNMVDKTWDCPCHGSRFDKEGNSIFGPSVYDIKIFDDL